MGEFGKPFIQGSRPNGDDLAPGVLAPDSK